MYHPAGRAAISGLQQEFQRIVDEHFAPLWSYVGARTGGSSEGEQVTSHVPEYETLIMHDRSQLNVGDEAGVIEVEEAGKKWIQVSLFLQISGGEGQCVLRK